MSMGKELAYYIGMGCGIILILWALLKSLGIINTPIWLEMVPIFTIGISVMTMVFYLGMVWSGIKRLLKIEERFRKVEHEHNLVMEGRMKCQ